MQHIFDNYQTKLGMSDSIITLHVNSVMGTRSDLHTCKRIPELKSGPSGGN